MTRKFTAGMSEEIYQHLFDMILSLKIKPGDRIPEAEIAKQFGVSRTPVRDALRDLAGEGILNLYPNRYAEVAAYDDRRVREIGMTKIVLDRFAIRSAAYFGSRAEYDELYQYAEHCLSAARENDIEGRIKADSDFHYELCKLGKNEPLVKMEKTLLIQTEFLQAARYLKAEAPDSQYETHIGIIEALKKGEVEEALHLITEPTVRFYNLENMPKELYM